MKHFSPACSTEFYCDSLATYLRLPLFPFPIWQTKLCMSVQKSEICKLTPLSPLTPFLSSVHRVHRMHRMHNAQLRTSFRVIDTLCVDVLYHMIPMMGCRAALSLLCTCAKMQCLTHTAITQFASSPWSVPVDCIYSILRLATHWPCPRPCVSSRRCIVTRKSIDETLVGHMVHRKCPLLRISRKLYTPGAAETHLINVRGVETVYLDVSGYDRITAMRLCRLAGEMAQRETNLHSIYFRDMRNGVCVPIELARMATKHLSVNVVIMSRMMMKTLLSSLSHSLGSLRIYSPLSSSTTRDFIGNIPRGLTKVRIVHGNRVFTM